MNLVGQGGAWLAKGCGTMLSLTWVPPCHRPSEKDSCKSMGAVRRQQSPYSRDAALSWSQAHTQQSPPNSPFDKLIVFSLLALPQALEPTQAHGRNLVEPALEMPIGPWMVWLSGLSAGL